MPSPVCGPVGTWPCHVDPKQGHDLTLSDADLMLLRAGLRAYQRAFEAHAAEDSYTTHDQDQVSALRQTVVS